MILQALYQLAQQEQLMDDPDFEPKPIAWIVRVSPEGRLLGIEGTKSPVESGRRKGKPKLVAKRFMVPRERPVTSGDRAFLLFNKAEYVFGIDPAGKREKERLESRFRLFREKARQCFEATSDAGVGAVCTLLDEVAMRKQDVELPPDCASNDLFVFVYSPDVDCLVTDREKVRAYWKRIRAADEPSVSAATCLVSGLPCSSEVLFPPVKRVPGGTTSGVALVSFNKNAFESYGWRGNANAPISRAASEACATALNRLLDPAYPDPAQPGQTLPRRSLRLSTDTVVCYWSPEPRTDEFCSVFAGLLEANPDEVKELYRSIWRGTLPEIENPSAFYALTLSGSQGRAIVRDWFESSVSVVAGNLALHFADLQIGRITPKPRAGDLPPQFALTTLLESLAAGGEAKNVSPPLVGELVEAALHGTPYPFSVLQRSIERTRAEIGHADWLSLNRLDARAALIKAFLNRRKRYEPASTMYPEVTSTMDPENRSEGYALGRLMAVLERLQQEALGDINASVVDRFFSGASATPKTVFVRLLKNSRHHAAKASESRRGLALRLERIIDELADRFDPKHNGFPAYLNLEQQGLFILGYHQMRRWLWMNGADREEWEKLHPNAPAAYRWSTVKQGAEMPAQTVMEEK